jgi:molecular chaperone Hsp33
VTVQRLPPPRGSDSEALAEDSGRAVILISSITRAELLDETLSPHQVLWRIYNEDGVGVFDPRPLHYACRCSRLKVPRILCAFPRAEIEEMAEDNVVTVTCDFCKAGYVFDGAAINAFYRS